jgi:RND family efflux transporter MFP subunit
MKTSRVFAVLGLPVLWATASGCREKVVATPLPVAVRTTTFHPETVRAPLPFSGTVRELRRVELSFKVGGTVGSILEVKGPDGVSREVRPGDRVGSGVVLSRLDEADYRRHRDLAREHLAQLQARRQAVKAQADYATREMARGRELAGRNAMSSQELDDLATRQRAAIADLEALGREIAASEVSLAQAEDDLKHCVLTAPFDAVVASRMIETQERIAENKPVFTLLDESELKVAFGVSDSLIRHLEPGQRVQVFSDVFRERTFTGRVTSIAPLADDATRTFAVEVTIEKPEGLRPGMIVTVDLGSTAEAWRLPLPSLQRGQGPTDVVVFEVVTDDHGQAVARRRRVELDGLSDDLARVRTGPGAGTELRPGARVVVTGADRLVDGERVRPLDELAGMAAPVSLP